MCILYNANTKQFISFDIVLHKMAATTDITAAREFTDDEADRLKQRCSSKLKNFQPYYRQQFDESGILLPDCRFFNSLRFVRCRAVRPYPKTTCIYSKRASGYLHQRQRRMRYLRPAGGKK